MIDGDNKVDSLAQILNEQVVFYVKKSYQAKDVELNRFQRVFEFL